MNEPKGLDVKIGQYGVRVVLFVTTEVMYINISTS